MGGLFAENSFELLQSFGIVAGLVFTAVSLRSDTKARRIDNLMVVTKHHREIWTELYGPHLSRVRDADVDLKEAPITDEEERFLRLLILHLATVFHARNDGLLTPVEGLEKDVSWFFSLPLPRFMWEQLKPLQDQEFARFVDRCLAHE